MGTGEQQVSDEQQPAADPFWLGVELAAQERGLDLTEYIRMAVREQLIRDALLGTAAVARTKNRNGDAAKRALTQTTLQTYH
jgi:hypothetical protein